MLTIAQRLEIKKERYRLLEEISNNNIKRTKKSMKGDNYPMPTYCLSDKKFNAKIYGVLNLESNYNKLDTHRYVYQNKINIEEKAKELKIGKSTLYRNIKQLSKLDYQVVTLENTPNGIAYILRYCTVNEDLEINNFVNIDGSILRILVNVYSNEAIKVYCLLKRLANEVTYTQISKTYILDQIGLCSKSNKNLQLLTDITNELELSGFISTIKEPITCCDKNTNNLISKTVKKYRICTIEEFKNKRKNL